MEADLHDPAENVPLTMGELRASSMVWSSTESTTSSKDPLKSRSAFSKSVIAKQALLKHKWLRLDPEGTTAVLQTGKHALTQRLGVQARDLRLLDAQPASSPPAILCRDRAIVVNLEFIKCIVTTGYALLLDSGEPRMASFVEELQRRLRNPGGAAVPSSAPSVPSAAEGNGARPAHDQQAELASRAAAAGSNGGEAAFRAPTASEREDREDVDSIFGGDGDAEGPTANGMHEEPKAAGLAFQKSMGKRGLADISEEMQFELQVLEVVLDYVTAFMEHLTSDIEAVAYPGLDAIVIKITERRLDRLRTVKSRLASLTSRVETFRELLERLLDDDDDMRDLNLTAKVRQEVRMRALRSLSGTGTTTPTAAEVPPGYLSAFDIIQETEREKDRVEQLLETYFMNLDNTYNKLQTLGEYIDDTEDYIQFDLDTKRNKFIEYRVAIVILTFCVTIVSTLYNILGVNLYVDGNFKNIYDVFLETVITSIGFTIIIAVVIMWYCRKHRILCY